MKVTLIKLKDDGNGVEFQEFENVQMAWVELEQREQILPEISIRNWNNDKYTKIKGTKITIL